jgi:hypothetical protein
MLTKPLAITFWNKIKFAPDSWFRSKEGKELTSKMIRMIEEKEGKQESTIFEGLCLSAQLVG